MLKNGYLNSRFAFLIILLFFRFNNVNAQPQNKAKEAQPEMPVKVNKSASPVTVRIISDSIKTGSGSIIGITTSPAEGHALILTACHVISSNYDDYKKDQQLALEFHTDIQVKIMSELTSVQAIILHEYVDPANDIALIKTEVPVLVNRVIKYTRSDQIKPGQKVAAFGFPETDRLSQTVGLIIREEGNFIIFNAKIASGSSGGPLVDKYGRMIGISMYTLEKEGYALKTDLVETFVKNWLENSKFKKLWSYSKYKTFWDRFKYPEYYIPTGGILGGVIYFIFRGGEKDKIFSEPPDPPP